MQNSPATSVEALVRSASRRRHGLLALEQINYALMLVLGGAILLLLVGTQILDWYWLVLLAVLGLATGVFRFRRRRQPYYQVAQILDRRLNLSDTLSTAWFVLTTPAPPNAPRQLQVNQAETVASSVRPQKVFPPQSLRAWAPNALLFLIVCTLFSVRYFSYDQLNFRRTLIPVHFGNSAKTSEAKLQTDARRNREPGLRKPDLPTAIATPPLQQNPDDASGLTTPRDKSEVAQETISSREARQSNGQPNPNAPPTHPDQQTREMQASNSSPNGPSSTSRTPSKSPPPSTTPPSQQAQQQSPKEGSAEEKSLTSKLRDVLSDLLAKMREGSSQQRGDAGGNQAHTANSDRNNAGTNQNHQSTSESNDGKESQASSLQSQQSQPNAETPSNSPSKGSGNASGHQSSDSRSAAGRQDGSKGVKQAEELKAMGKLEEIIGKRSASLKGEMTIDSAAGTQQLRTGYTNKTGQHSGIGSEIDHEQVPMEDQQYVREYMKQVHNQPPNR